MLIKEKNKGKHLTIDDRTYIEEALDMDYPLKTIAEHLEKDPTTVSKEIKRNRIHKPNKMEFNGGCNNKKKCSIKHLCNRTCKVFCKRCTHVNCYRHCKDFEPYICIRLKKYPHVCNGCMKKAGCRLDKYRYSAKHSEASYRDKLTKTREGVNLTSNELEHLDNLISPLIFKGQSLVHILTHHKDEIGCSERTLYNYFERNLFTAKNIDLPRKVRYKKRKKKKIDKKDPSYRINRTYDDFKAFMEAFPDTDVVEMDTVHGGKSGKVLLTLFFTNCSLMVAILLDSCTQECVLQAINKIYDDIGPDVFQSSFPVILTDNGKEFMNPEAIEFDSKDMQRTRVFYCNPMASYQKPHLEKNHEYIRYILPKGKSFNFLTQEKATLMMNHINSIARKSLNHTTPFKKAFLKLDDTLLRALSLEEIHPDSVYLKSALLK